MCSLGKNHSMILSYRYRLLPTKAQHKRLADILESERRLYNSALAERIDAYRRSSLEVDRGLRAKPMSIGYMDQTHSITVLNNDPLTRDHFASIPAFVHHWTLKRLDDAYQAFFRRVKLKAPVAANIARKPATSLGFPKFAGRDRWNSFGSTVQTGNSPVRLDGTHIRIGGRDPRTNKRRDVLRVRVHLHRLIPAGAILKAAVFSRCNRVWHVCLQLDIPPASLARRCQSKTAAIGIDLGISQPIAQSDGGIVPVPARLRRALSTQRRLQRALAKCKRGSRRRQKAKLRLVAHYAKVKTVRTQWAHKQAARLTRSYALIGIEDLAVANMTKSAKGSVESPGRNVSAKAGLNREILAVAWGALRDKLAYKAERAGCQLVPVDPRYTSQRCSSCGAIVPKKLSQRTHRCGECGLVLDRDVNAARNILAQARIAGRLAHGGNARNTAGSGPDSGGEMPSHRPTFRKVRFKTLMKQVILGRPSQ